MEPVELLCSNQQNLNIGVFGCVKRPPNYLPNADKVERDEYNRVSNDSQKHDSLSLAHW